MELRHFGWNIMTVGFLGTLFFIFLRAWSYLYQAKKIWKARSVQSISSPAFVSLFGAMSCGIVYGISIESIALIVNGSATIVLLTPILLGLWRFGGFSIYEFLLAMVLFVLFSAMIFYPSPGLFFVSTLSIVAFAWLIPWEIYKNKDAGVVDVRMFISGFFNSSFWLLYAIAIGDWVLILINPIILASIITGFLLWWRYRLKASVIIKNTPQ